jgi:hypothetical protein
MFARLGLLALHGVLKTIQIDRNATLAQRILRQVKRKP